MPVDIALAVNTLLKGSAAITALVGNQIYFDRLPQTKSGNSIVLWAVSEIANESLTGAIGLDQSTFQIDAYAQSRKVANDIAWTIWNEIGGEHGIVAGIRVQFVSRISGVRYSTDRVSSGSDQYRFIASQDLEFQYCSFETAEV